MAFTEQLLDAKLHYSVCVKSSDDAQQNNYSGLT